MTEIRGAIIQGQIDGAENNFPSYQSNGDYSIAPYFILDQHTRIPENPLGRPKCQVCHAILHHAEKTTSRTIMSAKPSAKPIVHMSVFSSLVASGKSSSTTT